MTQLGVNVNVNKVWVMMAGGFCAEGVHGFCADFNIGVLCLDSRAALSIVQGAWSVSCVG